MSKDTEDKDAARRVITGTLQRVRHGREKRFVEPKPPRDPVRRPARVAIALALAHKIEDAIQRGVARDRAEVARRLGLTRARVTQLLDLTLLAPELQAQVLALEAVDGVEPLSERGLRAVAHRNTWTRQRSAWASVKTRPSNLSPPSSGS
jgi:hypothetical protein